MARKTRIHCPGAIYHVILRGNAGEDVFTDDKERYRFYSVLHDSRDRFDHQFHAFCLMTNHIHLQIQVGEAPLSRVMQNIGMRYTQWFNWRHNRTGHVFQGRYKAVIVDADEYLLELAAYIHLNPVRAHITRHPEDHRWSSYRVYLGKASLSWLDTSRILSQFSSTIAKSRKLFAAYVEDRIANEHRKEFYGEKPPDSRIAGDEKFVETILAEADVLPFKKPDVDSIMIAIRKMYGLSDECLAAKGGNRLTSEARGLAAWATLEFSRGSLSELVPRLERDDSTLTCAARRIEKRLETDPLLADKVALLKSELGISSSQGPTP